MTFLWRSLIFLVCFRSVLFGAEPMSRPTAWTYPKARRDAVRETFHGVEVADPYRWLEKPDADDTRAWIAAQNRVTFGFLANIPEREAIKRRLTELWNYERFGLPRVRGGRYFYTRNDGLQNQALLYVAERLDAEPRVLLDPNGLSADGTVALADWRVSPDGRLLAYGLQAKGSDWLRWRVRQIDSGTDRDDDLKWIKFSGVSWTPDSRGFYYSRYDEPAADAQYTGANYFQKLFHHRLGDEQRLDRLVYERRDQKEWGFGGEVTDDGRYLVVTVWRGTERKHQVFYQRLAGQVAGQVAEPAPMVELLTGFDAEYDFIDNDGSVFWFVTDRDAPRRRVIAIDVERPEAVREVIPEAAETLQGVGCVADRFLATYLQDARSVVRVFDLAGRRLDDVSLPGLGSAGGFGGKRADRETFFSFTNYTTPASIYRFEPATGRTSLFRQPRVPFDPADYETKQVFVTSRDGTRVPMFVTHRKDVRLDGLAPAVLYGYGGFNIPLTPGFSPATLVWMERGGVYAVPNLRGGGEYGRAWHEAGMKSRKQNVFDDFFAAAEWLVARGYTSSERLAIRGGSNGGLLVGAAMTQRPDLFGAAAPSVGVLDMLRYHKFTIGWAWVSEYGSPDEPDEFRTLLAYSPLHRLEPGRRYPATLVVTSDHDDRVVPAHSFKFAAALQHAHRGEAPVLIRIETNAGHGAGTPTTKLIETESDVQSFFWATLVRDR